MASPSTVSAIEWDEARESLELITVPIPSRSASGSITVRVSYSGVCGTDLHVVAKEFAAADVDLLCSQITNHKK